MVTESDMFCGRCQQKIMATSRSIPGYGYSNLYPHYGKICYRCCGELDKDEMVRTGQATLYLSCSSEAHGLVWRVGNWPGSLVFPVELTLSKPYRVFGQRLRRHTVRFIGPDQQPWTGWAYNHNHQLINVRRIKKT